MRAPAAHTCFTRRAAKLPAAVVAAGCRDTDEVDHVWLRVLEIQELVVVDIWPAANSDLVCNSVLSPVTATVEFNVTQQVRRPCAFCTRYHRQLEENKTNL